VKQIKVIVKAPGEQPVVQMLDNTLQALQATVGGYVESLTLSRSRVLLCNEDGKRLRLQPNLVSGLIDPIVGTVIVAKHNGKGDFVSLTKADIEDTLAQLRGWTL
jgi:hypothetical protein